MNPYLGQITPFALPFAPKYWAYCDGSVVPLRQYTALFALIGTAYGGNGSTTFGLPNLNGAAPCGTGQGPGLSNRVIGEVFGTAQVTLDQTTMPPHNHTANAVAAGRTSTRLAVPTAASGLTTASGVSPYTNGSVNAMMAPGSVSPSGGNAPHNNMQPYIAMNYSIAMQGIYPSFG